MMKPGAVVGTVLGALSLIMSFDAVEAAAAGKKVAYFNSGPTHPYIAAMNRSFNARAKERGFASRSDASSARPQGTFSGV